MSLTLNDLRAERTCNCEPPWPACAHMPRTFMQSITFDDLVDVLKEQGAVALEIDTARVWAGQEIWPGTYLVLKVDA